MSPSRVSLFIVLVVYGVLSHSAYLKPEIWVYSDKACTKLQTDASFLKVDTSKKCQTIFYTDKAGKKFPATMGNYRCYKDKLVFDKYPGQTSCESKEMVNKNYSIPVDTCQKAKSHEGPVYEKLVNYQYAGNEDCQS